MDRRLDRASVERAHDVLYKSDAWTKATWLGAQALKNPLDLWIYQEIMVETRPELIVETGTYRGGSALFLASMCDLLGRGRDRLDRYRAAARGLSATSARHVPRRPLLDRSRRRCRGSRAGSRSHHARHPRLRPHAGARGGRARGVRTARAGRLLPHRRGLEHRPDPQGPPARPVRGRSRPSSRAPTRSRSIATREKFLITFNPSGYLRRVRAA